MTDHDLFEAFNVYKCIILFMNKDECLYDGFELIWIYEIILFVSFLVVVTENFAKLIGFGSKIEPAMPISIINFNL